MASVPPPTHNYTLNIVLLLDKTKKKKGNLGGVSPPRHLDAVVSSRLPFIVELSNIINIEIEIYQFLSCV